MSKINKVFALTIGEPGGIGADLIIKLHHEAKKNGENLPNFFIIGDEAHLNIRANQLDLPITSKIISKPEEVFSLSSDKLAILPLKRGFAKPDCCGMIEPENQPMVIEAIDKAIELAQEHKVSGIITNPIHKSALRQAGFMHKGHTDYLQDKTNSASVQMMLVSETIRPALRVIPATIHIPLTEVVTSYYALDFHVMLAGLKRDFGHYFNIKNPRFAFTGINPHAGEDGELGHEETDHIIPLLKSLREKGYDVSGPFPADSLFHDAKRASYDVVIAAYHDQALIPLKTLDFYGGVNITLGLPFIRTSPDHGTALSLAGTGDISTKSLSSALSMADRMAEASLS